MPHIFSFLKSFSSPLRSKKAMEMSLNTVIVAVIALLVLGLMIFVLARNGKVFNEGTQCTTYGGRCIPTSSEGVCKEDIEDGLIKKEDVTNLCNSGERCCSIIPGAGKVVESEQSQSEDG